MNESKSNWIFHIIIGVSALILYLIMSVLVLIIFIVTIRRSRMHLQRQEGIQAEPLLVTDNKWKILSKQLLPLVVYPIVNTVMAIIFYPLSMFYFDGNASKGMFLYSLLSSSGLITGTIIIIYLSRLKYIKKQGERKENERSQVAFWSSNHDDDIFTSETVASTDASTTYQYTRTSSFTLSALPVN